MQQMTVSISEYFSKKNRILSKKNFKKKKVSNQLAQLSGVDSQSFIAQLRLNSCKRVLQ